MLHEFLTSNRIEMIMRCREKAAKRFEPTEIPAVIDHGVPLFLHQLVNTLRLEQTTPALDKKDAVPELGNSEIGRSAALHGAELLRLGYSMNQVVHDYGDVCQTITELAVEQKAEISPDEFHTLNRCLDDAIADAVTSFGAARQSSISDQAETLDMQLDSFAEEQRRLVEIAIQSYTAIKTGSIGMGGATGSLLLHSLNELRTLSERTLPGLRQAA